MSQREARRRRRDAFASSLSLGLPSASCSPIDTKRIPHEAKHPRAIFRQRSESEPVAELAEALDGRAMPTTTLVVAPFVMELLDAADAAGLKIN